MKKQELFVAAAAVLTGGVLLYFFGGKLLKGLGGLFTGNNPLTTGTPYAGGGVAGTLGAATNKALGGAPQAAGERLGDTLYSWFGQKDTSAATFLLARFPDGKRHAVPGNTVDGSGYFTYQGVRFRMGTLNGERIAVRLSTGTGGI
jgi:hypothetical protein